MNLNRRLERLEARSEPSPSKEEWLAEALKLLTDEELRVIGEALERLKEEGCTLEVIPLEDLTEREAEAVKRLEEALGETGCLTRPNR